MGHPVRNRFVVKPRRILLPAARDVNKTEQVLELLEGALLTSHCGLWRSMESPRAKAHQVCGYIHRPEGRCFHPKKPTRAEAAGTST
jgi:hypothetical protein